ncbi:MAG: CRISPR-associated endonuclease Cas1 [Boseongicola sp.]|nr:CRISPR-associated endonuclease Cas1 [Boseongicola sp.]
MPALYVTEPGAVLRYRTGSLIVTRDEKTAAPGGERTARQCLIEVEPHHVETIGLVGRTHMTTRATRLCLDQGIPVFWMSRNGRLLGRLVPELSRTADLRLRQYRMFEDTDAALALGRLFIEAKIANAAALISALRSNRPGIREFGTVIGELETLRSRAASADDRGTLMGVEGDAARRYFHVLGKGFSGPIGFSGRQKRPPPDPANALLSFGYVLLANLIASLLEARGFDPYLGMLHTVRSGRPSLALDMMEEFRHPVVDRFVLRTCNRRQFMPENFGKDKGKGVRLTKDGLRRYFREWEAYLDAPMAGMESGQSILRTVQVQADRLAAHVRGTECYQPLRIS